MASCGEVDHSAGSLAPSRKGAGETCSGSGGLSPSLPVPECAICLQTCVHPVRLPCRHIFCFLCVKGASWQSKRCALCRQEVPDDFLERPTLLSPEELKASARGQGTGEYAWYYEGRNGWWQYDERTSRELEDAFSKGKKTTEMLIAGFLYVADLENMVQYRRNEHGRRRKMKRDVVDIPKKGVAGLRLDADAVAQAAVRENSADGADASVSRGVGSVQGTSSGRPPASLRAPPTSTTSSSPDHSSSLESAFDQLQISPSVAQQRGVIGEEEDRDESSSPRESSDLNTSVEELASSSEEEEDEEEEEGEAEGEETQGRHRLYQLGSNPVNRSPPGGHSTAATTTGVRGRRPDGQCTVTEV
ncbi:E3 ubiquitin-protein ligase rnf146-like [Chanos chanos]|uniref:E3 ubiquitin-protein ligase n=1 Tax=Chanos chanos TaxID=29144 RepID=A0A6J2W7P9_CHACN|nr:E3 ubiquitin-protein ligase RNF146 [Chanos chanos]